MSKKEKDGLSKLRPGDPGYVGRGHPPEHSRIKPGETKNPWGRGGKPPPDAAKSNFAANMRQLLAQPVRSKDGQTYSYAEIFMNGLMKPLAAGDVKAGRLFLEVSEKFGQQPQPGEQTETLGAEDNAILESFEQEILVSAGYELTNKPSTSPDVDVDVDVDVDSSDDDEGADNV